MPHHMKESIEARIGRYLAGEMDVQEAGEFQNELAANPELEGAYSVYKRIWQAKPTPPFDSWNEQDAWIEFERRNIASTTKLKFSKNIFYWAAAASIVLLIGATFYFLSQPSPKTYLYSDVGSSWIELLDGSKVHLNKGSAITVFPFNRKGRHVELSGEAFFEVSPDPKRSFTIDCGKTVTEVVGTSFNIREEKGQVQLFVHSGKVIFRSVQDAQHALALKSGEAAFFENNKMNLIPNPSPNTDAWHSQELRLNKLTLEEAIRDISAYFGKVITLENPEIRPCRIIIPLPFKHPEIHDVLRALAKTINAQLIEKNEHFTIKGGSCS